MKYEQRNYPKPPAKQVKCGVGIMLSGVALYLYSTSGGRSMNSGLNVAVLLLIGVGFVLFTRGAVRYLKELEAQAKAEIEKAEQEKAYDEKTQRTEKQKKRGELDTLLSAGLISRDEYDCAKKKYEE